MKYDVGSYEYKRSPRRPGTRAAPALAGESADFWEQS